MSAAEIFGQGRENDCRCVVVVRVSARIIDRNIVDADGRLERGVAAREDVIEQAFVSYEAASARANYGCANRPDRRSPDAAEPESSSVTYRRGRLGAKRLVQGWPAQALFAGLAAGTRLLVVAELGNLLRPGMTTPS